MNICCYLSITQSIWSSHIRHCEHWGEPCVIHSLERLFYALNFTGNRRKTSEKKKIGEREGWKNGKKQSISVFLSFWFKSLTSIILSWLFFTVLWTSIEQTKSADFRDVASACSTCCLVYPLKRNQRVPLDISVHYLHKRTFFFLAGWPDLPHLLLTLQLLLCLLYFSHLSSPMRLPKTDFPQTVKSDGENLRLRSQSCLDLTSVCVRARVCVCFFRNPSDCLFLLFF